MNENAKTLIQQLMLKMQQENTEVIGAILDSDKKADPVSTISAIDLGSFNSVGDIVGVTKDAPYPHSDEISIAINPEKYPATGPQPDGISKWQWHLHLQTEFNRLHPGGNYTYTMRGHGGDFQYAINEGELTVTDWYPKLADAFAEAEGNLNRRENARSNPKCYDEVGVVTVAQLDAAKKVLDDFDQSRSPESGEANPKFLDPSEKYRCVSRNGNYTIVCGHVDPKDVALDFGTEHEVWESLYDPWIRENGDLEQFPFPEMVKSYLPRAFAANCDDRWWILNTTEEGGFFGIVAEGRTRADAWQNAIRLSRMPVLDDDQKESIAKMAVQAKTELKKTHPFAHEFTEDGNHWIFDATTSETISGICSDSDSAWISALHQSCYAKQRGEIAANPVGTMLPKCQMCGVPAGAIHHENCPELKRVQVTGSVDFASEPDATAVANFSKTEDGKLQIDSINIVRTQSCEPTIELGRNDPVVAAIQFVDSHYPDSYSFHEKIDGQVVVEIRNDDKAISNTFPTEHDAWMSAAEMIRKGMKPTPRDRQPEVLDRKDQICEKPRSYELRNEAVKAEAEVDLDWNEVDWGEAAIESDDNRAYVLSVYPDATIESRGDGGWAVEVGDVGYKGLFEYLAWKEAADTISHDVALAKEQLPLLAKVSHHNGRLMAEIEGENGAFTATHGNEDRRWLEVYGMVYKAVEEKKRKAAETPCNDELWVKSIYPQSECFPITGGRYCVDVDGNRWNAATKAKAWGYARVFVEDAKLGPATEHVSRYSNKREIHTIFERGQPVRYQVVAYRWNCEIESSKFETEEAAWIDLAEKMNVSDE